MEKLIMPCIVSGCTQPLTGIIPGDGYAWSGRCRMYVRIRFQDGNLRIHGAVGPRASGDTIGSNGQNHYELKNAEPAEGWTREMLDKLHEIWLRWESNDSHLYCEHQRELGWREIAKQTVKQYNYRLTREARKKQVAVTQLALDALRKGKSFTPSDEQTRISNLPYTTSTFEELVGTAAQEYELDEPTATHHTMWPPVVEKRLGEITPTEHPNGILCKKCPVCGFEYGSTRLREEVPQDVIDWLFALPDSPRKVVF